MRGIKGLEMATKMNEGRKMPSVASSGAGDAAEEIADERRGGEHRAGRHLADGDSVEQLLIGEPAQAHDEIGAEEGEQDVAAAVQHRADLEKRQKHAAAG